MPSKRAAKQPVDKQGQIAESLAKKYLQQQGLRFITQNYHCRHGEIDLIMSDKQQVVFVEVKYRQSHKYGYGFEAVNQQKQRKIIQTAKHYLHRYCLTEKISSRFDIISVDSDLQLENIYWLKNAFIDT